MARKVPISPRETRRNQAWWKCPYCKAGGQKISCSRQAIEDANIHFLGRHPFRDFRPYYVDDRRPVP
jgi:hypothetical protein